MRILGISGMFHDASATMIDNGNIVFAGHAERYSREKNDPYINKQLMKEACAGGLPDVIVLHESSKLKKQRRIQQEANEPPRSSARPSEARPSPREARRRAKRGSIRPKAGSGRSPESRASRGLQTKARGDQIRSEEAATESNADSCVSGFVGTARQVAFFIRNKSGNASCTNNMSVSDCHGNHENIAYFIGFIDNRDG